MIFLKDLSAFLGTMERVLTCKAKYKWQSLDIEPDLIAFSARWCKAVEFMGFFTVDVSFKLITLSCEAILFWWSLYLSTRYSTEGYSSGSAGQRQCGGGLSMRKPAGSWGMFFSNPALMHCSNSDKDAYIIPLIFFGDKHTAYKFQLWIWDPLWDGKTRKGTKMGKILTHDFVFISLMCK